MLMFICKYLNTHCSVEGKIIQLVNNNCNTSMWMACYF